MRANEAKEAFARAKFGGLSNRDAAIAAGYSAKTASAAGSRLAKDPFVCEELAKLAVLAELETEAPSETANSELPGVSGALESEALPEAPAASAPVSDGRPAPVGGLFAPMPVPGAAAMPETPAAPRPAVSETAPAPAEKIPAPVSCRAPAASAPVEESPPIDFDARPQLDLVNLTTHGRRLQAAGLLKVRGFVVEVDAKVFDVLASPKDQLELCRLGIVDMDTQQRDVGKTVLPYIHGKVADQGKKDAERDAAVKAMGGLFSPIEAPIPDDAEYRTRRRIC